MSVNKYLQLPGELLAARRRSHLLQKQAAAMAHVCQTVLSACEKGRRTPEGPDLLRRLANVYDLDPIETERLLLAGDHDHLLIALKGTNLEAAAELLSAAIRAYAQLSKDEVGGLILEIEDICEGKQRVAALTRRRSNVPFAREGDVM